jgi:hypothetical protein
MADPKQIDFLFHLKNFEFQRILPSVILWNAKNDSQEETLDRKIAPLSEMLLNNLRSIWSILKSFLIRKSKYSWIGINRAYVKGIFCLNRTNFIKKDNSDILREFISICWYQKNTL